MYLPCHQGFAQWHAPMLWRPKRFTKLVSSSNCTCSALPTVGMPKSTAIRRRAEVVHEANDIIVKCFKVAAERGVPLRDAHGRWRLCFPIYTGFSSDKVEEDLYAGTPASISHQTLLRPSLLILRKSCNLNPGQPDASQSVECKCLHGFVDHLA